MTFLKAGDSPYDWISKHEKRGNAVFISLPVWFLHVKSGPVCSSLKLMSVGGVTTRLY